MEAHVNHFHPNDVFIEAGGIRREVPALVIEGNETLQGTHNGSVCVHSGTLIIARGARHNGSLTVRPAAHLSVLGTHNGSLTVSSSASVDVTGAQNGSTHVDDGGVLRVAAGGRLAGSLTVAGLVKNAGERGGSAAELGGKIVDLPGSSVKDAERSADGTFTYRW